ncbi:MAG: bifunctional alpha/beta hydrolase/class I SAM-dependent methyltransferase [Opitutaceae bacterium]|nr:bifunctional alpha/beta hydrolase/class I SAM-dependent methyltransferase [Opitutaceae bacterium]
MSMNSTEHAFTSWDGTSLFYRAWLPARPTTRALLLFHRGHEHSGRWQETVEALALEDTAVFAWEARGHGRSPGERGSAENLVAVIKDADAFARHLVAVHGIRLEDTVVLAHSVGAVVAAAWIHDFAPPVRGLVLAVPAFRVKLYVPFAVPLLRLKQKLFGPGYVKSYVKAKMLTHDPEQAAAYAADPMIFRQIAVNILLDLFDTSTRLLADAGAITVPTLMLTAGADWVVKQSAQRTFFERLSSPVKEMEIFPDMYHAVFHEKGRDALVARTRRFILERFAQPVDRADLLDADQHGYTKNEYDRLQRPGSPHFAITRASMKTLGRMSAGIALGWRSGFDSGTTLDYIYENRARGFTPIGRLMDRSYLDAIGWRGIRVRRANLERMLRTLIEQTHATGQPVRILDIATGAGRYVLETLHALRHIPATALLRDYKEENLEAARRTAKELGVQDVTFTRADAFDPATYENLSPRPTIGIVSGLHELIPDNARVRRSLEGLARAIPPGGHLIYTGQPWHPQVEFIARVLRNREGQPWIMRRRTQAEMDELVRAAGFDKIAMDIDPWGIFTVSVAIRR